MKGIFYRTLSVFLSGMYVAYAVGETTIRNPLGDVGTFADLVRNLANAVMEIAIPFVIVFLIYAGFLFVSARGNEKQLTRAKEVFYWTIIGGGIVVGAAALASAAVDIVRSLGGGQG